MHIETFQNGLLKSTKLLVNLILIGFSLFYIIDARNSYLVSSTITHTNATQQWHFKTICLKSLFNTQKSNNLAIQFQFKFSFSSNNYCQWKWHFELHSFFCIFHTRLAQKLQIMALQQWAQWNSASVCYTQHKWSA